VSLRSFVEDGGARLRQLLSRLGVGTFRFPKVHSAEVSQEWLETLGFRPAGGHLVSAGMARSDWALRSRIPPDRVQGFGGPSPSLRAVP
jgi:hypothetical protein